jgi:hypothetical protein
MQLDLTDHEAALLLKKLNDIIDGDRYFLSRRIRTLTAIPRQAKAGAPRDSAAAPDRMLRRGLLPQRGVVGGANEPSPSIGLGTSKSEDDRE